MCAQITQMALLNHSALQLSDIERVNFERGMEKAKDLLFGHINDIEYIRVFFVGCVIVYARRS